MKLGLKNMVGAYGYLLLLVLGIGFSVSLSATPPPVRATEEIPDTIAADSIVLQAKAAALYDVAAGRFIYAKNAESQLPIASLTKLMTALTAASSSPDHNYVRVTRAALGEEGDSGLLADERWRLSDLINLTLISSSNDGAAAIAEAVAPRGGFVDEMNALAAHLGLTQTYFRNPTGLDLSLAESGGYSSAHDVAKLFEHIIRTYPEVVEKTRLPEATITSASGVAHDIRNTNKTVASEIGVFASKTGFTDLAGGNLAVAFDAGPARPMIAVVLGSTQEDRFSDTSALISASLDYIQKQ